MIFSRRRLGSGQAHWRDAWLLAGWQDPEPARSDRVNLPQRCRLIITAPDCRAAAARIVTGLKSPLPLLSGGPRGDFALHRRGSEANLGDEGQSREDQQSA